MHNLITFGFLLICNLTFCQTKIQDIKKITPSGEYANIKVIPVHNDMNSSVFLIYVKQAVRKHIHKYHTEVVTVLEGKGTMYLDGASFSISPGDHIVIPQNTAHAVITTSKKPLKVLSVQSPQFLGKDRVFVDYDVKN
jgi:mannose-6-phosphate isomerase-like protein (cupin superfamily)